MSVAAGSPLFTRIPIPTGMDAALEGLTKEVLKKQPHDIYWFAAQHFEQLIKIRELTGDILVLGVGDNTANKQLNRDIIKFMRKHRINVEALPTEQACSTFNFLNAESRYVAGALIPPNQIRATEDDILQTKLNRKKLYEHDDDF